MNSDEVELERLLAAEIRGLDKVEVEEYRAWLRARSCTSSATMPWRVWLMPDTIDSQADDLNGPMYTWQFRSVWIQQKLYARFRVEKTTGAGRCVCHSNIPHPSIRFVLSLIGLLRSSPVKLTDDPTLDPTAPHISKSRSNARLVAPKPPVFYDGRIDISDSGDSDIEILESLPTVRQKRKASTTAKVPPVKKIKKEGSIVASDDGSAENPALDQLPRARNGKFKVTARTTVDSIEFQQGFPSRWPVASENTTAFIVDLDGEKPRYKADGSQKPWNSVLKNYVCYLLSSFPSCGISNRNGISGSRWMGREGCPRQETRNEWFCKRPSQDLTTRRC